MKEGENMYQTSLNADKILTYTGIVMNPADPLESDISIKDIAHCLSFMCRANGHIKHFFSVGQHSIYCYEEAFKRDYPIKLQLALLLHDGSEAYLADITRPVKHNLHHYLEIESRLQKTIYKKFGIENLSNEENILVDEIDNVMLYYEFLNLTGKKIFTNAPKIKGSYTFKEENFETIENTFLKIFEQLCDKINRE